MEAKDHKPRQGFWDGYARDAIWYGLHCGLGVLAAEVTVYSVLQAGMRTQTIAVGVLGAIPIAGLVIALVWTRSDLEGRKHDR